MKRALEYIAVFTTAALFFAFYQFQSQYVDTDGYYHSKIAYVMCEQGFLSNFKWAHLSTWRAHFSDKEFLYHVYLMPFVWLFKEPMFGAKVATVMLAAGVATSFYAILRINQIKFAWLWLLLLFFSGGYFLYRVNVARPQVLSIIFVLWSIHFIINRKLIHLAVLCFLYTYSYTAYHLPVMFATGIYLYQLIFEKENDWKTPAVTLGAMLAGMLLSPFFPDNARMFFMQNVYIPWMAGGSGLNLHMGGEFGPMDTRSAVLVNTAVILSFIAAFFTALHSPVKWDRKTISIFLVSLLLILFTALSKRFAEYSVPVTLLFCAFFFSPYLEKLQMIQDLRKGMFIGAAGVLILIALAVNSYNSTVGEFRGLGAPSMESCAKYLLEHTEDDELVYTGDWDDAPELFYFNHKNRYLVFLDPNFMYYWNEEVWKQWDALSNGRLGDKTYNALKDDFKVRYGVATNNFQDLRRIIERDERMDIVHEGNGAFVFKLDENAPASPVSDFKPPALDEVIQFFIQEKNFSLKEATEKATRFYDFFEPKGWMLGADRMSDWKYEAERSVTWE